MLFQEAHINFLFPFVIFGGTRVGLREQFLLPSLYVP